MTCLCLKSQAMISVPDFVKISLRFPESTICSIRPSYNIVKKSFFLQKLLNALCYMFSSFEWFLLIWPPIKMRQTIWRGKNYARIIWNSRIATTGPENWQAPWKSHSFYLKKYKTDSNFRATNTFMSQNKFPICHFRRGI